jgi:hypothetical protein
MNQAQCQTRENSGECLRAQSAALRSAAKWKPEKGVRSDSAGFYFIGITTALDSAPLILIVLQLVVAVVHTIWSLAKRASGRIIFLRQREPAFRQATLPTAEREAPARRPKSVPGRGMEAFRRIWHNTPPGSGFKRRRLMSMTHRPL